MTSNFVRRYINIPVVALCIVVTASLSAAIAMTATVPQAGASAYGAYPYQPYPADALSVRDDRCYSSLNRYANSVKLFGVSNFNFGLVNAVMNLPIYDWDQNGHGNPMYEAYQWSGSTVPFGSQGIRGSLEGKSVGYAERFNFSVSPIPNMTWVTKYITKQLPYDVSMITGGGAGASGQSRADPLIANPFIYSQGALITPGGMPRFQALSGPLYDNAPIHGGLPNIWEVPELLGGAVGGREGELAAERDRNQEIYNNSSGIIGAIQGADRDVDNFIGMIGSTPILQNLNAYGYEVDAWDTTGKRTLCYESMESGNTNIVPAYAFSVPGAGIPVTIPGWIYSIATLLDGKGFSASGMTMYLGGSLNGKDMLDCFGRGVQPTVYGHNSTRMAPGFILDPYPGLSIPMALFNFSLYAIMEANGMGAVARNIPAIITAYEDYTTGYAFLFNVHDSVVENPAARRTLPAHLNKRAVDYSKSKLADINLFYAAGQDGRGHDQSQNSQQFNPDVYLKLYSPFVLRANFEWPVNPRQAPDGTELVDIKINASKHGFKDNNRSEGGYKEDTEVSGGPTYDPNKPEGSDRSFSEARVYKMVMKPGTVVNAIDASKVKPGTEGYYRADTSVGVNAATAPCEFFANQLRVGDSGAKPSALTPGAASNANNDLPDAPVINNSPLTDEEANFACGEIATKKLEMRSSQTEDELLRFTEKISPETPPGTKICFAVYYTDYTNDLKTVGNHWWNPAANHRNWNPDHNTPSDKTYLTRANCIISGYKPSFQVRGGDLIVGGKVDTGLNRKDFIGSEPQESRTYGSWAEYGVIAQGRVTNLGSGALYRTGMPQGWEDIGYLTFSNNVAPSTDREYGEYNNPLEDGFTRIARQFTSMNNAATEQPGAELNLASLNSGVYELVGNKRIVSKAADGSPVGLDESKSIILLARDGSSHTIADNITIPTSYDTISKISQVVIAPATTDADFRINIADNVTNVDAWLVTPKGTINTCYTGLPSTDVANTPRALTPCEQNQLQINGPVSAERLILRRSGGKDQSVDPNVVHQSIPGENFNLRPDAYIWAAQYVNDGGKKYITTHSMDLPPRY